MQKRLEEVAYWLPPSPRSESEPYHQVRSTWDSKFNGDVLAPASNPVYLFGLQESNKVRCKAKVLFCGFVPS